MALGSEVFGVNKQLKLLTKHLHAASLGVGGRVVDASQVEFWAGHAGNCVLPASLLLGVVGKVTLPYWS